MYPFLRNLFFKEQKTDSSRIIEPVKRIHKLVDEINTRNKKIEDEQHRILIEQKDELFLSISDFFALMDKDDISMEDIMQRSTHITELKNKVSVMETYSFLEDDHLILCPNKKDCAKHKELPGSKIRITSIKVVS